MLGFFATLTTLSFVLIATLTVQAQRDPGHTTRISIGTCFSTFVCTNKGSDVQGTVHGPQHIGCNGFVSKFPVHAICKAGDCSSGCTYVNTSGGVAPGGCLADVDVQTPIGCVKL